jgi:hypothetical protein
MNIIPTLVIVPETEFIVDPHYTMACSCPSNSIVHYELVKDFGFSTFGITLFKQQNLMNIPSTCSTSLNVLKAYLYCPLATA